MAMQVPNYGSGPGTDTGDKNYDINEKWLANFSELYGQFDSFPAVHRGTVSAARWSGVTKGTGLAQAARQANLTALQAALNYAATTRKFFEIEPGDYEIEGTAGLVIPQTKNTGFVWKGTKGSYIKQFSNNCPILTIGDITNSNVITEQAVVEGFRVGYATDQRLNTASTMVRIGSARNCTFAEWNVYADSNATGWPAGSSVRAYRGITMQHAVDTMSYFSNTMRDVMVGGCEMNHINFGIDGTQGGGGTGNIFSNIYCANGVTGNPQPIAGPSIRMRGEADLYEGSWDQINIEWNIALELIFMEIVRNAALRSWHFEGNRLSGADPRVFNLSGSRITFDSINLLDTEILSATATGTPSIFFTYNDSSISGNGLDITSSAGARIDRSFLLMNPAAWSEQMNPPTCVIAGIRQRDVNGNNSGFLSLDANLPVAAGNLPSPLKVDVYRWNENFPQAEGVTNQTVAGDITVYGCYERPLIVYPATLGAARQVILSNRMKPSGAGIGGGAAPPVGALVGVRRGSPGSGTATYDAFALTVKNLTSGGTTLATFAASATPNAAASVEWFRFDGTNWTLVAD